MSGPFWATPLWAVYVPGGGPLFPPPLEFPPPPQPKVNKSVLHTRRTTATLYVTLDLPFYGVDARNCSRNRVANTPRRILIEGALKEPVQSSTVLFWNNGRRGRRT